jgi:hypothetical protein
MMARYAASPDGGDDSDGRVGKDRLADDAVGASEPVRAFTAFAEKLDRPSLGLRLRVSTQASALDNALARGASPLHSRELALRARQLVEPKRRELLAHTLESLCEHAERATPSTTTVPLPRDEITESGESLRVLARRLRDPRPVYAAGAAMVSALLRDGTGPAFTLGAGPALRRALRAATAALDGAGPEGLWADRQARPREAD